MIKFSTIIAIHLRDGLPSIASEEFLLLVIKLDTILVELLKHLDVLLTMRARLASSISSSLELSFSTLALPLLSWLALNAKSFFLVEEGLSCGVMCIYCSNTR